MTTIRTSEPIEKRGGYGSSSVSASKLVASPSGPAPGARPKAQPRAITIQPKKK